MGGSFDQVRLCRHYVYVVYKPLTFQFISHKQPGPIVTKLCRNVTRVVLRILYAIGFYSEVRHGC